MAFTSLQAVHFSVLANKCPSPLQLPQRNGQVPGASIIKFKAAAALIDLFNSKKLLILRDQRGVICLRHFLSLKQILKAQPSQKRDSHFVTPNRQPTVLPAADSQVTDSTALSQRLQQFLLFLEALLKASLACSNLFSSAFFGGSNTFYGEVSWIWWKPTSNGFFAGFSFCFTFFVSLFV